MTFQTQNPNWKSWLTNGALVCGGLILLFLFWTWPSFVRSGIQSDLREYHRAVRESHCSLDEKLRLLDHIDFLRDSSQPISFLRWVEFDGIVHEMLDDGLSDHEVIFLGREFQRLRSELEPDAED